MDILQKYKYLIKPIIGCIALYFSSSDVIRHVTNLFTIVFLIIESYISFQFRGRSSNVLKVWIIFGIILGFDYVSSVFFGRVVFPTLTNILRVAFLLWLTYDPANITMTYDHLEPYLKIMAEHYNFLLSYVSKNT